MKLLCMHKDSLCQLCDCGKLLCFPDNHWCIVFSPVTEVLNTIVSDLLVIGHWTGWSPECLSRYVFLTTWLGGDRGGHISTYTPYTYPWWAILVSKSCFIMNNLQEVTQKMLLPQLQVFFHVLCATPTAMFCVENLTDDPFTTLFHILDIWEAHQWPSRLLSFNNGSPLQCRLASTEPPLILISSHLIRQLIKTFRDLKSGLRSCSWSGRNSRRNQQGARGIWGSLGPTKFHHKAAYFLIESPTIH